MTSAFDCALGPAVSGHDFEVVSGVVARVGALEDTFTIINALALCGAFVPDGELGLAKIAAVEGLPWGAGALPYQPIDLLHLYAAIRRRGVVDNTNLTPTPTRRDTSPVREPAATPGRTPKPKRHSPSFSQPLRRGDKSRQSAAPVTDAAPALRPPSPVRASPSAETLAEREEIARALGDAFADRDRVSLADLRAACEAYALPAGVFERLVLALSTATVPDSAPDAAQGGQQRRGLSVVAVDSTGSDTATDPSPQASPRGEEDFEATVVAAMSATRSGLFGIARAVNRLRHAEVNVADLSEWLAAPVAEANTPRTAAKAQARWRWAITKVMRRRAGELGRRPTAMYAESPEDELVAPGETRPRRGADVRAALQERMRRHQEKVQRRVPLTTESAPMNVDALLLASAQVQHSNNIDTVLRYMTAPMVGHSSPACTMTADLQRRRDIRLGRCTVSQIRKASRAPSHGRPASADGAKRPTSNAARPGTALARHTPPQGLDPQRQPSPGPSPGPTPAVPQTEPPPLSGHAAPDHPTRSPAPAATPERSASPASHPADHGPSPAFAVPHLSARAIRDPARRVTVVDQGAAHRSSTAGSAGHSVRHSTASTWSSDAAEATLRRASRASAGPGQARRRTVIERYERDIAPVEALTPRAAELQLTRERAEVDGLHRQPTKVFKSMRRPKSEESNDVMARLAEAPDEVHAAPPVATGTKVQMLRWLTSGEGDPRNRRLRSSHRPTAAPVEATSTHMRALRQHTLDAEAARAADQRELQAAQRRPSSASKQRGFGEAVAGGEWGKPRQRRPSLGPQSASMRL